MRHPLGSDIIAEHQAGNDPLAELDYSLRAI